MWMSTCRAVELTIRVQKSRRGSDLVWVTHFCVAGHPALKSFKRSLQLSRRSIALCLQEGDNTLLGSPARHRVSFRGGRTLKGESVCAPSYRHKQKRSEMQLTKICCRWMWFAGSRLSRWRSRKRSMARVDAPRSV